MKFLRLFATVLAVCAFACPALAQKTKSTLQNEINANFPDQITGFITPADARTSFTDFLASWQQATQVNAQVNTSYTIQTSDYGNLVTFNNAGTVSVSIPQAVGSFATFNVYLKDLGAGSAVITPQGGLINGAGSLTLGQGQQVWLVSDGTNWQAWSGVGSNIACSSLPALTGDVANPAGSCATTIQPGVVTGADIASGTITGSNIASNTIANSNLTQAGANTLKGNPTGSTANEQDTSVPSCSSANQALQWTSGTGFSCANISFLSAKASGAVGNGSTDDTTALQNWINSCQTNGLVCLLDAGTYKITSVLTCSGALTIEGISLSASVIQPGTSVSGISCTTTAPVTFRDFAINYASAASTSTAAFTLTASGAANLNTGSRFDRLGTINAGNGFSIGQVQYFVLSKCLIENVASAGTGVTLNNTGLTNVDTGDSTIEGCTFALPGSATGVFIQSFAGLRIVNNKMIGDNTASTNINLTLVNATITPSDLQISGNSLESKTNGILLQRAGTNGTFTNVNISGNEIEATSCISTDSGTTWLSQVNVTGNICQVGASGNGIIANTGTGWNVTGNTFYGGSSTTAIAIGANVVTGLFSANTFDSSITNHLTNSSTTAVLNDQQGMGFTSLPAQAANGSKIFLTNADPATSPCTHSGAQTGSSAFRQNGAWKCF